MSNPRSPYYGGARYSVGYPEANYQDFTQTFQGATEATNAALANASTRRHSAEPIDTDNMPHIYEDFESHQPSNDDPHLYPGSNTTPKPPRSGHGHRPDNSSSHITPHLIHPGRQTQACRHRKKGCTAESFVYFEDYRNHLWKEHSECIFCPKKKNDGNVTIGSNCEQNHSICWYSPDGMYNYGCGAVFKNKTELHKHYDGFHTCTVRNCASAKGPFTKEQARKHGEDNHYVCELCLETPEGDFFKNKSNDRRFGTTNEDIFWTDRTALLAHIGNHLAPFINDDRYPAAHGSGQVCTRRFARPQDEERHRESECSCECWVEPRENVKQARKLLEKLKKIERHDRQGFRKASRKILLVKDPTTGAYVKVYDWLDKTNNLRLLRPSSPRTSPDSANVSMQEELESFFHGFFEKHGLAGIECIRQTASSYSYVSPADLVRHPHRTSGPPAVRHTESSYNNSTLGQQAEFDIGPPAMYAYGHTTGTDSSAISGSSNSYWDEDTSMTDSGTFYSHPESTDGRIPTFPEHSQINHHHQNSSGHGGGSSTSNIYPPRRSYQSRRSRAYSTSQTSIQVQFVNNHNR